MKPGIEYSEKSWNPMSGCLNIENGSCGVGKNCWAYKMSLRQAGRNGYPDAPNQFMPTFHPDRLDEPIKRKKPTIYNVSFMGDIAFAHPDWLPEIINAIKQCPQHRFIFLTKRPELLAKLGYIFPDNCIVGVTVNCQVDVWRIEKLLDVNCELLWVSFEPIYSSIEVDLCGIDFVVVGAQTNPEIQPEREWVQSIIDVAEWYCPIFTKPNLKGFDRRELPKLLQRD